MPDIEGTPGPQPQPTPGPQPTPPTGEPGVPGMGGGQGGPDGAGTPEGVQPGSGGMFNSFGALQAENVNFTYIQRELDSLYETRTALRHFTCKHGEDVSESWEEACERDFRGSDDEVDALLEHLEERRVLLLKGPPGAGRVTAAIYLGRRLRTRGTDTRPTLLVQSLARQVHLDVRQVATRDKELRGRMVIFRDLLGRVERADRSAWEQLAAQLRERSAYAVFITEARPRGVAPPDDPSPAEDYAHTLSPHPLDVLQAELDARIEALEQRGTHAPELLAAVRGGRDWLLQSFHFAPQMAEFVSRYAALNQPELPPAEAWRRLDDPGTRLLRDRDGDLDGWAAVLTLALAQCVRDARGARWVEFDALHRRVSDWLRADVERRAGDEAEEDEEPAAATPPRFQDAPLLEAAHAETYADPATLACGVRFRDGVAPEPLWQALLARHRRALLTIFPGLRQLAEGGGDLSVLAAQVIGRLGEMDPERITLPLATRWLHSTDARRQRAVGPLFEGVLGSASKPYRDFCLRRLRSMRSGGGSEPMAALIAAYSWIGDYDLGEALGALGVIAEERLAPMIADVQRMERLAGQARSHMADASTVRSREAWRRIHARLGRVAENVYREQATTFVALQMSLGSLCVTRGVLPVIVGMHGWVRQGGWKMGVLVALLLLKENGIADTLQQSKADVDGAGCNPLVECLAEGEGEVRQVAEFLRDVFESLATPFLVKTELARDCSESLVGHLADWMRDALPVPAHVAGIRNLLETMLRIPALTELVQDLLESPWLADENPRLRVLITSLRR